MDVDGARLTREVRAPHPLEEDIAGEHHARLPRECGEEVELTRAKPEAALADVGLAAPRIDPQLADLEGSIAADRGVGAPEDSLHPRHQGSRIEGLRDVVVRAELEPDDRIDVVGPCGQHQDRGLAAAPNLAADLEAVDLGEHEVQHDEVGIVPGMQGKRLLAIGRGDHAEALLLEVQPDEVDDVPLVVDHEDRFHGPEDTAGGPADPGIT